MKKYLPVVLLLAFAFFCSAFAQTAPPNIVVILADDSGYGDVGFNGSFDIPTPNIDSIAADGVLCTDGYVTEPYCSPSRAALLTGRYQERYGQDAGPPPGSTNPRLGLPLTETILPQLLKPAGYVCGAVGKWHLGYQPDLYATRRGFDEFFGFLDAGSPYYHAEVLRNETPLIENAYLTEAFTREGVDFINRHAAEPSSSTSPTMPSISRIVTPSRTAEVPPNPTPRDPIKVKVATSDRKSAEEHIYVRWSTDSFVTSHIIEATGSGRNYSVTIPAQPKDILVLYTIVTSTADLTPYSTSDIIDPLILATTNIFNAVPPIPPSITLQPADTTVRRGAVAEFRVKAGGTNPFTYQWKKNGTNISGATGASYKTPPTTAQDNGAVSPCS